MNRAGVAGLESAKADVGTIVHIKTLVLTNCINFSTCEIEKLMQFG
jgi:hypothetical protein